MSARITNGMLADMTSHATIRDVWTTIWTHAVVLVGLAVIAVVGAGTAWLSMVSIVFLLLGGTESPAFWPVMWAQMILYAALAVIATVLGTFSFGVGKIIEQTNRAIGRD